MKDVAKQYYIITMPMAYKLVERRSNGEKDRERHGAMLSQLPTLGAPRLVTLRYSDIGGSREDAPRKSFARLRRVRIATSRRCCGSRS